MTLSAQDSGQGEALQSWLECNTERVRNPLYIADNSTWMSPSVSRWQG
jgi:hypothetical protein